MNVLQSRLINWLTFISICLFSFSSQAASFYASVSKNKVVKNEVFQLRIVSDQRASSDDIDFTVLEKDFSLGRPSFGSSINIINGSRSNKSEWTVSLAATHIGYITIPSFELDGEKTQPITIEVSQDEHAPDINDLVEVQTQLSKSNLYPNESALLKARLIIKADPRRLQNPTVSPPAVPGLDLKAATEANQYQTIIDGVEVTIVDQDFRITAEKAGSYQLSEPVFKGTIVYGSRYNGGTRLVPIETTPKKYQIKVEEKPADFKGSWLPASKLDLTQHWLDSNGDPIVTEQYQANVGDSITRELRLQVTGLTQEQLPNIKVNYPAAISMYDEKPQFETLENGDVVMTIKQVLIPRESGDITLDPVTVNWWNTNNKHQQSTSVAGLTLQVKASDQPLAAVPTPVNTPPQVNTVTVKDSGIWPYLTALFASLWLITLVVAWRFKSRTSAQQLQVEQSVTSSSEYEAVINALANADGIAICAAINAWIPTVQLTDEEQAELNEKLNKINQSLYSPQPKAIDTKTLKRLIDAIQKQQSKRGKTKTESLAAL